MHESTSPEIQRLGLDRLRGRRLLIAEDEEIQRELLANYLRRQGCHVYLAGDGAAAIAQAQRLQPELVLMDVNMPVYDGLTACRMLKSDHRTRAIDIIFMSGNTAPDDRVKGLLAGAVDYILKPFSFEEVGLRLTRHLQKKFSLKLESNEREPSRFTSSVNDLVFEAARAHLHSNLGHTPKLDQVARTARTNVSRLNHAFKHCVDMTVFEYLREERMKKARKLLTETQLEIQSIAQELGFTSGANFTAAFKTKYSLTPSQFRQKLRHDKAEHRGVAP
jgi:DNA-binding response OmpR family regulator